MKNSLLNILTVVTLIFVSCNSEEDLDVSQMANLQEKMYDKDYIKGAELNEQLGYRIFHLSKLVNELNGLGIEFDKLFSENTGKNKGYNKLFFSDLLYSNAMDNKGGELNETTEFSLGAFNGMSELNLLPYIEEIKDGDNTNPIFLISSFDEEKGKENVIAFKFNLEGLLEIVDSDISEEDVFGNETGKAGSRATIYRVDSDGCGKIRKALCDTDSGTGGSSGSSSALAKFEYITIKDKKESWLNKADIRYEHVNVAPNSLNAGVILTHCGTRAGLGCYWNGSFMAHCNNREVNKRRLANKSLGARQGQFGDISAYVIFEYDSWPAPTRVYEKKVNGGTLKIGYRSYQSTYDELTVNFNNSNPYGLPSGKNLSRNNSDIEYNIK